MSNFKLRALASACALLGAMGLAASAHAQATGSTATINGGGSTLLAPYWVQAANCFDSGNTKYYKPGTPASPQVTTVTTGSTSSDCTSSVTSGLYGIGFDATGSGAGVAGVFSHSPNIGYPYALNSSGLYALSTSGTIQFGSYDTAGTTEIFGGNVANMIYTVQYGLSDNPLVDTDLCVYEYGTSYTGSGTTPDGGSCSTPSTYQGLTFTGSTNGAFGTNQYLVPKGAYGQMVEFPVSVDTVVLAYNPTYVSYSSSGVATNYTLNVSSALKNADGSGGLRLSQSAYCKIFTGEITDWNDSALTALNGGTPLIDTADGDSASNSHPITLVGRSDSSGTTSILTRHLAAACGSYVSSNPYTAGVTTLPTGVQSLFVTYNASGPTSTSTLSSGSSGVATTIHNNPGAIGYLGPDYALPYVTNTGANTYGLNVADLENASGQYEEATPADALTAFSALSAPSSSSYNNPVAWVASTAITLPGGGANPLANPSVSGAYPIVGTTNFVGYTCYANSAQLTELEAFITYVEGSTGTTILNNAGLGQLPLGWKNAIKAAFMETTANSATDFAVAGSGDIYTSTGTNTGYVNSNCQVSGVTGG